MERLRITLKKEGEKPIVAEYKPDEKVGDSLIIEGRKIVWLGEKLRVYEITGSGEGDVNFVDYLEGGKVIINTNTGAKFIFELE